MNRWISHSLFVVMLIFMTTMQTAEASIPSDLSTAPEEPAPKAEPTEPVQPLPHVVLSDVRVRKAIAYCTDKDALIASVHPDLTPAERQALIMDTIITRHSWAYSPPPIVYSFNPTLGQALLDEAGWLLPSGSPYRMKDGRELVLTAGSYRRVAELAA